MKRPRDMTQEELEQLEERDQVGLGPSVEAADIMGFRDHEGHPWRVWPDWDGAWFKEAR